MSHRAFNRSVAYRSVAVFALPAVLAVSLVGCSNKGGDGAEASADASQSQSAAPESTHTESTHTEPTQSEPSDSSESASQDASSAPSNPLPDKGSELSGYPADPHFVQFVKGKLGDGYETQDAKEFYEQAEHGDSPQLGQCDILLKGLQATVTKDSQAVIALKLPERSSTVAVQAYTSPEAASKPAEAIEQLKKELKNPACAKLEISNAKVKTSQVKDTLGFKGGVRVRLEVEGEDAQANNLYVSKGTHLMVMVGDLETIAADGKKVYDALP
ncbi:hypothetical protein CJ193_005535 [Pseudoglutamicibacter albus]|uniref:hypothetical protein n=1 Tax=Pseudoglutamicibacter albus TaxID=98671 RepID=UPI000C76756E|nr:hypothetical protein [Pseudoglutamicibacter albus]PKY80080.1 hypothetical protein CYJ35_06675 [Pseudoglutamicibacter albus]WIK83561.1 hypothetical protein CJ193_005535 [Pseudoglutamicibacter albus]